VMRRGHAISRNASKVKNILFMIISYARPLDA
jgi:hypothetical protein